MYLSESKASMASNGQIYQISLKIAMLCKFSQTGKKEFMIRLILFGEGCYSKYSQ